MNNETGDTRKFNGSPMSVSMLKDVAIDLFGLGSNSPLSDSEDKIIHTVAVADPIGAIWNLSRLNCIKDGYQYCLARGKDGYNDRIPGAIDTLVIQTRGNRVTAYEVLYGDDDEVLDITYDINKINGYIGLLEGCEPIQEETFRVRKSVVNNFGNHILRFFGFKR